MLALVHPFTTDVPHHSSRRASSSTSSLSRPPSAALPPAIHRNQIAPSQSTVHFQIPRSALPHPPAAAHSAITRPSSPPPKPPRIQAPTVPLSAAALDIHSFPPAELLKLLATLLTQIAATNDHLAPSDADATHNTNGMHSPYAHSPIWNSLTSASRTAIATPAATLSFHARNIPTITLEAYLMRILKYCPTTNHVFLSLLVYFDRMSKLSQDATSRAFVIDSYNIHRLVIAGVTVASKFFSDVFYTNSRYAKVGGLPLPELNQLELQFLLLNDFRLVISSAEMQRYAEQLVIFSRSTHTPMSMPQESPIPKVTSTFNSVGGVSAPMRAMGAGPYGHRAPINIADDSANANQQDPSTPRVEATDTDDDQFARTDTDTEAETDGGSTTDDEPTIRAGRRSIGSTFSGHFSHQRSGSEAENVEEQEDSEVGSIYDGKEGSLYSADDENEGDEDETDDAMEVDGSRTPERKVLDDGNRTPERRDTKFLASP